jgi:hypothetical protein
MNHDVSRDGKQQYSSGIDIGNCPQKFGQSFHSKK